MSSLANPGSVASICCRLRLDSRAGALRSASPEMVSREATAGCFAAPWTTTCSAACGVSSMATTTGSADWTATERAPDSRDAVSTRTV